jgi:alanyl-tRNA synthetase
VNANERLLKQVAALVRGNRDDVTDKVQGVLDRARKLEKEVEQLKAKLASGQGTDIAAAAVDINGVKVIATRLDGADAKSLRNAIDGLKDKLKSAVIVLGTVEGEKVVLVAGVTADLVAKIKAGEVVGSIAALVGGKGGGRPDFAQAGGTEPGKLDAALATVVELVRQKLG